MTEHPHPLADVPDAELVQALISLGRTLTYADPDVATAVARRLHAAAAAARPPADRTAARRAGGRGRRRRSVVRRALLVAGLVLVLATGAAAAAGLGVPGIVLRPSAPDAARVPGQSGASDGGGRTGALAQDQGFLGRPVSLAEARAEADFAVAVPDLAWLGPPEVFVADQPPGGRVSLRYPDAGVLLTQFRAELDDAFFVKGLVPPFAPEPVTVAGAQGWWVEGRRSFTYRDADGRAVTDLLGQATNALLWSREGITHRLETDLPQARAIEVGAAVSLGP